MERPVTSRDERPVIRPPRWDARIAGGLFLGWIVLARSGPLLQLSPGIRAWYPPAALLAAACILWGVRALVPVILAASAMAIWTPDPSTGIWHVLVVSALLKVIYWLCARPLRTRGFDPSFSRASDVTHFGGTFVVAAAIAAAVGTIDSVGPSALFQPHGLLALRTFWVGDVVAVFALAPALIVGACWMQETRSALTVLRRVRRLSPVGLVQVVSIPAALAVSKLLAPSIGFFAYALCFLPLGWIALEHGSRIAALANAALSVGAVWTLNAAGATAPGTLELQAFIGMLTLTGLLVGSVAGERERAFALLGESEERYRKLVELLPDPLLVHADGRVLFANGAAAMVLGAPNVEALTGMRLADMAVPSSRPLVEERLRALSSGAAVPLVRHTMKRLDSATIVDVEAVSIPLSFQGRAAALTVARDVTTRVRLEEELRHAQRMEAVGRLAGGVAHDFNNLLTVIISYSELLLAQLSHDSRISRDVQEIRHAADRAAALTRQLLTFSRRQVLQPDALDINEVVCDLEGLLRRLIGPEIEIVARVDPAAGMVFADKGQLEQVIVNLVVNARDAMPDGGVLTVETQLVCAADAPAAARARTSAEHYAAIVVRDTGAGMDEATLRRIFDPFFTTKEMGRGTGLGLSTVHGIVEQSGGTVTVESLVGIGSEFRILLPSFGATPASEPAPPAPTPALRRPTHDVTRVLLVEDDAAVRAGLRRMLDVAGYDVLEAEDGAAALDAIQRTAQQVNVVLSDVAMPTLDGRGLARELRARWPGLPLILMSGFADRAALDEISGLVILQKPLAADALVSAIETAVNPRRPVG
jgi:two-component system cell cycle sensor histidine kinase/response regulator CckA